MFKTNLKKLRSVLRIYRVLHQVGPTQATINLGDETLNKADLILHSIRELDALYKTDKTSKTKSWNPLLRPNKNKEGRKPSQN